MHRNGSRKRFFKKSLVNVRTMFEIGERGFQVKSFIVRGHSLRYVMVINEQALWSSLNSNVSECSSSGRVQKVGLALNPSQLWVVSWSQIKTEVYIPRHPEGAVGWSPGWPPCSVPTEPCVPA